MVRLFLIGTWALVALASSSAQGATFRELFQLFKTGDYAERYNATLEVLYSREPRRAKILTNAIEAGFFEGSPAGLTAAEFVRLKLAGEEVLPELPPEKRGRNIFLISVDTLRSDHLGAYGRERSPSPEIDRLAARGAVFERALATSSWTLPSHMSMFTSLYPSFHKLDKGGKLGSVALDPGETTLVQILKQRGYTTVGIVAHPFLSAEWGFDRGFDYYKRYATRATEQAGRAALWLEWHQWHASRGLVPADFFLFLHFLDPHETYHPPAEYQDIYVRDYRGKYSPTDKFVTLFSRKDFESEEDLRYARALYDGEIHYVDDNLGQVFQKLRDLEWEDSTLVILTSDHGEEFKDHDSMGHKNTLYREQLEVPLIMAYPARLKAGQRIETPVSVVDLMPTVLDLLGAPVPESSQGRSLLPLLDKKESGARRLFAELGPIGFAWERDFYRRSVQSARYKLIHSYRADGSVAKELYAIAGDPTEQRNIYEAKKSDPDVQALESELAAFIREGLAYNAGSREKYEMEIDPETQERLRSLGYME